MVSQASYLMTSLCLNFGDKLWIVLWVHRAGKHEVLPNEQTEPVALLVKGLVFVNPTAPYPQHRHVAVTRRADEGCISLRRNRRDKRITRDPVGSARENRDFVEDE